MANPVFQRSDDFSALYANNIQFESSAWDLKVIFGQLDQSPEAAIVEQHTAMTVSWMQAKITAYFLTVNTLVYESANGRIHIPDFVTPLRPNPEDPTLDEAGRRIAGYLAWIHDQFFSPNPYVPPGVESLPADSRSDIPVDSPCYPKSEA